MRRRIVLAGTVALVFGLLAGAPSSQAADPRAFVNTLGDQGIQTLGAGIPLQQRVARFRQLFQADFDVSSIGRFAIGRYWQAFTPEQQQEFLKLFVDYTVLAYADKLGQYGGAQFQVTGSQNAGGEIVVNSDVVRPGGQPIQMDWHLTESGGGYKVSDVYVDRVSMKVTQRDEFAKVIQNNGGQPSALLAVLRQQIEEKQHPAQEPMPIQR